MDECSLFVCGRDLCWDRELVEICVRIVEIYVRIVEIYVRVREVCVGMLKRSERASLCYILILACIRFQNYEKFLKKSSILRSFSIFFAHFL